MVLDKPERRLRARRPRPEPRPITPRDFSGTSINPWLAMLHAWGQRPGGLTDREAAVYAEVPLDSDYSQVARQLRTDGLIRWHASKQKRRHKVSVITELGKMELRTIGEWIG